MFACPRRFRLPAQHRNATIQQSLVLGQLEPSIRFPSVKTTHSRNLSSIAKIQALSKPAGQEGEEDDLLASFTKRRGGRTKKGVQKISPKDWLLSEEGLKFRHPTIGRTNWLGDEIPFPTNPWFKPQVPLSDKTRTKVYESFKQRTLAIYSQQIYPSLSLDEKTRQEQILIRETSEQWGICRERVSAIIKLKAMEDAWPLNDKNEEGQPIKPHKRTLQLNFEKGMESVLGVQTDQVIRLNEDINELANRRLRRKSSFYGTQFVPIDSPQSDTQPSLSTPKVKETQLKQSKNKNKYQEYDQPSGTRHIIGSDGLPRPPTSYISKPANKIPMVFTDVSEFPRAPKPMSKRQARYFPKTSLLPDYSAEPTCSSQPTSRRSHSTIAPTMASVDPMNSAQFSPPKGDVHKNSLGSNPQQVEGMAAERRILATRLLSQLRGCSSSENSSKLLDQISTSSDYSEFRNLTGIDEDQIKESLLLRAGGLSFKTPGDGSKQNEADFDFSDPSDRSSNSTIPSKQQNNNPGQSQAVSVLSEDEKQIRSIKFEMIKSIYLKKLELNSSGRLLLPKSVRSKEEKDLKLFQHTTSSASTSSSIHNTGQNPTTATTTGTSSQTNPPELSDSTSNQLVRRCMKGPLGRMKQRQQLQLLAKQNQPVNH
ncbi:hypothetical protein Pst134EA_003317 [Puccinia striiformis f. sp. tritici]|uniref:Uncharacterized protein n=1 Tax=Puccinia striiformis f. sp. tritici PST-78 TaxID=1165861 RepID=A0A0L0UTD2_9BASI|nr:hypothetical protein Pst134EA_003317 [Puccinia striiformis f. sp. tritici]KAH9472710.1 hypothetical protein Pst134EA_003317 [Puccinia striiformis f. sp. tritici]KAI9620096.1 hypothetical protein KEM48_008298 [Puccinia striiformis f. sp. tritici PST-130]KNE90308.1 hypothetical protein PSTG_16236 [Puccinia striiformis f. sp. tritici PST-78]KNE90309.1 hypothetical protein, variant [Puccinia striiformis f. sp. tritici PST-78]